MKTTKYVTKQKRIRQLEKEIEQLKAQVQTLVEMLDQTMGIAYRSRPGLARSMERGFHDELLPSQLPKTKSPRHKLRRLPLLPRADLVNK